jgi:hypothetical protein
LSFHSPTSSQSTSSGEAAWRTRSSTSRCIEAFRQRLAATATAPNEAAAGLVSSYAIDDGDRLLLFDPLAVPREIEELAKGANR